MNEAQADWCAHDLGGRLGFGLIERGENIETQLFAEQWEKTVFSMTLACGMLGAWNLDQSRFAREQMDSQHYLASSYYEHWLHGLEQLLVASGLLTAAELHSGKAERKSSLQAITAQQVPAILRKGAPTKRTACTAPLFAIGAQVKVRTRDSALRTHTRAPRYTGRRAGVVAAYHGVHIFADEHAASGTQHAHHLYNVRFTAQELWGNPETARAASVVYVDLFEPYLEVTDQSEAANGPI